MTFNYGREICGNLNIAQSREWLITNGIGGYGCGTVAGVLTRCYHGLLVAALNPPLKRTLLLSKLDETIQYDYQTYACFTNRWFDGNVSPHGYLQIESFRLEGKIPVWTFACGDALIEKRIWMQQGSNTTYIRYHFKRGSKCLHLSIKALINYRDHHGTTQSGQWKMSVSEINQGVCVRAFPDAIPFYILAEGAEVSQNYHWHLGFDLAMERYRGLWDRDDHYNAATFNQTLQPGDSLTIVATTNPQSILTGHQALEERYDYEAALLNRCPSFSIPWMQQLVLAADQFIVDRPLSHNPEGKTIIAGYPWFADWGRDTMIALPGLTLTTGRPDIAHHILSTFAKYLDGGMLPNVFPDDNETPQYNTVDAILWYFEAIRAYYDSTNDIALLTHLYPLLQEVIDWHRQGTRYNIHLDSDHLIYAGQEKTQLTWMDAKVGDWVVTPRKGKPIEVNALWYNALIIMVEFSEILGHPSQEYQRMAQNTHKGFQRYWHPSLKYCHDVLDTPTGHDKSLRPNQIFAVSLPDSPAAPPLLKMEQQKSVVDTVAKTLVTSYGLRSLCPTHHQYKGHYGGDQVSRDGSYHQGVVWGWLIGHFVQAHWRVYGDRNLAKSFLEPMANHVNDACIGNISEIFDGDAPMTPRGCFAQAWSVAEVLRVWTKINES
ncbi:amylo-alpha-1,6-glucosidase [Crocosphaera sp. UHCC 0190]|uniref:amylo-alpha-1,6-glucosidase n=1 Tax=Crocosphaera sp. UHCC 0190 TaxID=3110246 RepID=UPI002B208655|nr:amylo-alpha-1,6-glucosidase [Crocosphaera sp. UHCC 0190]MEA5508226.1 amylo-alpha-1,6-glucosidase [Crocosphaera sp. UHCC 0190]